MNAICYKTISILMLALLLVSCLTDDREIKITTIDPGRKPVIEAELSTDSLQSHVRLTWLSSFNSTAAPQPIHNAVVLVKDSNTSKIDTLKETVSLQGDYAKPRLVAISGHSYQLSVTIEGKTYTAKSTIGSGFTLNSSRYSLVDLGSVFSGLGLSVGQDSTQKSLTIYATGQSNNIIKNANYAAKLKLSLDNEPIQKSVMEQVPNSYEDELVMFSSVTDSLFKASKSMTLEIQVFDKDIYTYLKGVENASTPGQAAPVNPVSNISGGALGYFNVHTSSVAKLDLTLKSVQQKSAAGTRKR